MSYHNNVSNGEIRTLISKLSLLSLLYRNSGVSNILTLIGISPRSSVTKEGNAFRASNVGELIWIFNAEKPKKCNVIQPKGPFRTFVAFSDLS